jgi:glycosyltransferase involved in cell wall biosynthesis
LNPKDLPRSPYGTIRRDVRILMDYRPALRQRTGAGEYVHRLAAALVPVLAAGDTLARFSSSWKDRLPPDVIPGAKPIDARIPVTLLNFAWHRLEWPPAEWFAGPVDIAQSMHPLLLPSRRAARFVTIHDLYFLDRPEHTASEIRRDYATLAARHATRADGVVVPSEYTRGQVQSRLGVERERLIVCSPGAPEWPRRDEPQHPGPILFVGTIDPRKNVIGLLRAYADLTAQHPDAPPLVMAGRVNEQFLTRLRATPDLRTVVDRAQWLGYVSDARRLELYRAASMLVLPSFDEGFGLPVLEAMTVGVPVVASNRGSLPEVTGDSGQLVDPDDHAGLAAAMARILEDPAERRRMSDGGVLRARAYSWDTAARRLCNAYLAASATGRRR